MKLPHIAVAIINFAIPLEDGVTEDFTWGNLTDHLTADESVTPHKKESILQQ